MLHGQQVTVLDFGIAARIGEPDDDSTGASFGTPAYVASERLDGTPARAATDIYALGVVLHEMLTGSVPFRVRNWDEVAIDHGEPPVLVVPGLPKQVSELVRRCLRREPDGRPEATEVALVLQRALAHPHPLRSSRGLRWSAAVAAGVTAFALFGWWQAGGKDDPQPGALASPSPSASSTPTVAQTAVQQAATTGPAAPSRSSGGTGISPTASPAAQSRPVLSVGAALDAALATIDGAVSRGELRDDVAHDLRQLLNNMVNNSSTQADIDGETVGVKSKIASRERERSISIDLAAELRTEVDQLAAALSDRLS
jgi:serine/threonine-protein kinase